MKERKYETIIKCFRNLKFLHNAIRCQNIDKGETRYG